MIPDHRIALAGFGNVGQAVAGLIADKHRSGEGVSIVGVSDPRFGTLASKTAIDADSLLEAVETGGFEGFDGWIPDGGVLDMIDRVEADTLVELTFTDLETGEPARTHVRSALEAGLNVSTTNKGPIALHYPELRETAVENGVVLAYEGTVMSGSPAVELARSLTGAGCMGVMGILNGTTNFVISQMEEGSTYGDALTEAQERGYAEADPSGDVEGHDTAGKLAILAQILAGETIPISSIERVPLSTVRPSDISAAANSGERWRYVGQLEERDRVWRAAVSPRKLPRTHPLSAIGGATNAVTFQTELLGDVTISGPGAGRQATAYAVLSDLRQIQGKALG